LGISSITFVKEKDLAYDPRFKNDFFYSLANKMSPGTGIDILPTSPALYKDFRRGPIGSLKQAKEAWPYDEYAWAASEYEPFLERSFKVNSYRPMPEYPHFKHNIITERTKYLRFKYILEQKVGTRG